MALHPQPRLLNFRHSSGFAVVSLRDFNFPTLLSHDVEFPFLVFTGMPDDVEHLKQSFAPRSLKIFCGIVLLSLRILSVFWVQVLS